jgi:hypothetical protein
MAAAATGQASQSLTMMPASLSADSMRLSGLNENESTGGWWSESSTARLPK